MIKPTDKKPADKPTDKKAADKKPLDKKPSAKVIKTAEAEAAERIARAEQRIREGNATREEILKDCEREKRKRELARDVVGALTWSFTAMGLGQGKKPKAR